MHSFITKINQILWGLTLLVFLMIIVRMFEPLFLISYREYNDIPATIAVILFMVTLVPGTLQRMGMRNFMVRYLIIFRRTLGIAMYLSALTHFLFLVDELPWFSDGAVMRLDMLTASGVVATVLLLPALLSSNTVSIRFFRKWWKVIQRVTYITIPLIALHLWQSDSLLLAGLLVLLTVLIVVSYIVVASRKNSSFVRVGRTAVITMFFGVGVAYLTMKVLVPDSSRVVTQDVLLENDLKKQDDVADVVTTDSNAFSEANATDVDPATDAYTNGTYTANGSYTTDHGKLTESVDLTLTLEGDIVVDMEIVGNITNSKSQRYHNRFASAVETYVIGEDIASIAADVIAGSSDTTDGFMLALENIKSQTKQ